jgi:hypothetical protein
MMGHVGGFAAAAQVAPMPAANSGGRRRLAFALRAFHTAPARGWR